MPYDPSGSFVEPTNDDLSDFARVALEAFGRKTKQITDAQPFAADDEEFFYEVASDLICDLAHLARRYGHDMDTVIANGLGNFAYEVEEEEGQQ